ncbi:hypothetical protein CK203_096079 [Vitis vinifera]|uniref:Uncharacterized protein n=1 Tax=Vitis vinifera TaxID=29760 RepID=A0A438CN69_VITVI|nr:hypothetical protein CK203_096079 [Vitis vinifera]
MTPEVIIRRPMVTQPPIEGNLDCRARLFHSKLCFDRETFRLQPKLRDSFHLIQRHIPEALHIPYEPARPEDYRVWLILRVIWFIYCLGGHPHAHIFLRKELSPNIFLLDALLRHNIYPLQHMVQRRGALLEALFQISEGFFFGPHHLIMTVLLYFEEKVHRKKLLRAHVIPLLFPRLLCHILEHLGYPSEPQLERKLIFREIFTLNKWNSMTAYDAQLRAPIGPEQLEIA